LKEELSRLQGEYAFLASKFKPDYSQLTSLRAQVIKVQSRIDKETRNIVAGIESAWMAAKANEAQLSAKLAEEKEATLSLKDAAVDYASLMRDADSNRQMYEAVLTRLNEIDLSSEMRASNVFVIDAAMPPSKPSSPRPLMTLAIALFVGLLGGVSLAFLWDQFDGTVRSPQELERRLQLAMLGTIPDYEPRGPAGLQFATRVRELAARASGSQLYVPEHTSRHRLVLTHDPLSQTDEAQDPFSPIAEAYRAVRTSILLSRAGEAPRTILFTSPGTGEGKTTTTLNTAIMFAQLGAPVLVIDADLRRPQCHEVLGTPNEVGLTELLTGQADPAQAVQQTRTPLFLLSSGKQPPNPSELLGSERMKILLGTLQKQYEYILIDSPPVNSVIDPIVLSPAVDGVVLVIDQTDTSHRMAREARKKLEFARARILGTVLNRSDHVEDRYFSVS